MSGGQFTAYRVTLLREEQHRARAQGRGDSKRNRALRFLAGHRRSLCMQPILNMILKKWKSHTFGMDTVNSASNVGWHRPHPPPLVSYPHGLRNRYFSRSGVVIHYLWVWECHFSTPAASSFSTLPNPIYACWSTKSALPQTPTYTYMPKR